MKTQAIGQDAEDDALAYLCQHGLKLVGRNFSCVTGEVDLIMRDHDYLVFIEVRARSSQDYGGGIASVTYGKRKKILKTASFYMMKHKVHDKFPVRFDVISIDNKTSEVAWIKDAFGTNY